MSVFSFKCDICGAQQDYRASEDTRPSWFSPYIYEPTGELKYSELVLCDKCREIVEEAGSCPGVRPPVVNWRKIATELIFRERGRDWRRDSD